MAHNYDIAKHATTIATVRHVSQGVEKVEIEIFKDEEALDILTFVLALEAHKALF